MRLILIFTFTLISANLNQTHPYSGIFHPPIKAEKDASSLTYPIGSLSLGLFISLLAYHRTKRNKELLSHDKLRSYFSFPGSSCTPAPPGIPTKIKFIRLGMENFLNFRSNLSNQVDCIIMLLSISPKTMPPIFRL